jgi:NADH-quinone oxidoreductase subunit J
MRTRIPILIAAAALALVATGAAGALAPSIAAAQNVVIQPGQPGMVVQQGQPGQPGITVQQVQGAGARPTAAPGPGSGARAEAAASDPRLNPKAPPHLDEIESTGKGTALLFWAFALAAVGGALFVVTRRNLIAAVMGMVGSFLGIAAVYMMLYASFLSVIQMLVYAGAIMVLFVFVIMILNRPEDEPVAPSGRVGQAIGGLAMVYLVFRLGVLLVDVRAPESAMAPPAPTVATVALRTPEGACDIPRCEAAGGRCAAVAPNQPALCRVTHEWGTVKSVGTDLFGPGAFPFEAISILLLVAVVGAIAIPRALHEDPKPGADAAGGEHA